MGECKDIISEFASLLDTTKEEILGNSHTRRASNARQLLWWTLNVSGYTVTWIAGLCNRSHATVSYGINNISGLLAAGDPLINQWYEKTKNLAFMSEKQHMIKITPPKLLHVGDHAERYTFYNYRCPYCNGRKKFVHEIGKDEYEEIICDLCDGVGRIKADVTVKWTKDDKED
jgi:hypothetical protein